MALMFLSARIGLLAILPNVLAIVVFFGVLGWFGVRLNLGTSLIATIALGIAVDSSVHYMGRLSRELRGETDQAAAIQRTLRAVGGPILYTTLALRAGFLTFAGSSFVPIRNFGMLTAITLATAFGANLVVLPALLATTKIITLWDLVGVKLGEDPTRTIPLLAGLRPAQARIVVLMGELRQLRARRDDRARAASRATRCSSSSTAPPTSGSATAATAAGRRAAPRRRLRRDGAGAPRRAQRRRRRRDDVEVARRRRALPAAHPAPLPAHRRARLPQPDPHPQRSPAAHERTAGAASR